MTRVSARWPKFTLAFVILVSCGCIGYTFFFMKFKTDRADLIDPKAEFHKRWIEYTKAFGDSTDAVVVAEAPTVAEIKQMLDETAAELRKQPELFGNILYKFDAGGLRDKWMQYLNPRQLQAGLQSFDHYGRVLQGQWNLIELKELFPRLGYQLDQRTASTSPEATSPQELRKALRQADMLTTSLDKSLADPDGFRSPWPDMLPVDDRMRQLTDETAYFLNERKTMGFLRVVPLQRGNGFAGESESLDKLREIRTAIVAAHPKCKLGLTGIPVLESDEMRRSQFDMSSATVISTVGCLLLMFFGFRGVRHPLLGLLMSVVGIVWGLGFATAVVGHLNILSMSFASIVLGLGIDFAIIYTSHYLELRHEGWQLRPALMETTNRIGTATMTGAVTTAFAFLCTLLTEFSGIAELGIIAAGGVVLCAIGAFFVLPAMIALADKNVEPARLPKPFEGTLLRGAMARFPLVMLVTALLVVFGLSSQIFRIQDGRVVSRINYDYNLLNLQAKDVESVVLENRIFEEASSSLLFAVSIAGSEQQCRELHAKFSALPSVHHVEDLAWRLPANPPESSRQLLSQYRMQVGQLPQRVPQLQSADPALVGRAIEDFYIRLKKLTKDPTAARITATIDGFLDRFEKLPLAQQTRFLNEFQYRMADSLLRQFQMMGYGAGDDQIRTADMPSELVSRFVTRADTAGNRRWLLQVYPKDNIWDEAPLAKFIADVRSVDENATGTPIQNYEAARQIKTSYQTAALYAFAAVWIVLLVDFLSRETRWLTLLPPLFVTVFAGVLLTARRIHVDPIVLIMSYVVMTGAIGAVLDPRNLRDAILAYSPPLAGMAMTFGILGLLGVDLNPANLIVLPLILGIGEDSGVHVVYDYRHQPRGQYRLSASVFNAILMVDLTSIVGFGSLMVASHRGLFSLGLVLSIGVSCCMFISLIVLPSFLSLASRREAKMAAPTGTASGGGAKKQEARKAA